jgi:hypothetical protein
LGGPTTRASVCWDRGERWTGVVRVEREGWRASAKTGCGWLAGRGWARLEGRRGGGAAAARSLTQRAAASCWAEPPARLRAKGWPSKPGKTTGGKGASDDDGAGSPGRAKLSRPLLSAARRSKPVQASPGCSIPTAPPLGDRVTTHHRQGQQAVGPFPFPLRSLSLARCRPAQHFARPPAGLPFSPPNHHPPPSLRTPGPFPYLPASTLLCQDGDHHDQPQGHALCAHARSLPSSEDS